MVCTKCGKDKDIEDFAICKGTKLGRRRQCKKCVNKQRQGHYREYSKEYRKKNKDKLIKKGKEYRRKNKDKLIKMFKEYRVLHKEHLAKQWKARYEADKERFLSLSKIWRESNVARHRVSVQSWRAANRDKCNEYNHKRRALNLGAGGLFSDQDFLLMCQAYNFTCLRCNKKFEFSKLTRDHVIPLSKDGDNYISNIQPLCGPCNSKKHVDIVDYR